MLKTVAAIAIVAALIATAYWALLFFAQRSMLFPAPPPIQHTEPFLPTCGNSASSPRTGGRYRTPPHGFRHNKVIAHATGRKGVMSSGPILHLYLAHA